MVEWIRVSKGCPCPICGKEDWCGLSADGEAVCCMRVEAPKRAGNGGYIHRLGGSVATALPKRTRKPRIEPKPGFDQLASEYQAAVTAEALAKHALKLGVSVESLSRLGIGWDGEAWTFPMVDATGRVVGIRRRFDDGRKLSVRGGHEGLFVPSGLSTTGTLYVAEGPTDVAALLTLGLNAIGRPNCRGAVELCRELCRGRVVVIVADADKPGREGAQTLAAELATVAESVRVVEPPSGTKDIRAWVQAGATAAEVQELAGKAEPFKPSSQTNVPDDWADPIPFGQFDVPTFPLEAIPTRLGELRTFCETASESIQVPTDAVSLLALAVAGTALAKRVEVLARPDWREPVNLFCVVAMPSGERKSALFRSVIAPLADFEREENERLAPLIEKNRNERLMLEAELKQARSDAIRRKNPDERLANRAAAEELTEQLRTLEEVLPLQLVADDATPEAISKLLDEQGGRLALLSPEGDVFDLMNGRYSDSVARLGVYLKGHAGDDIRVNRVGRPSEFVRHPALSCGLTVQPDVLQGLLEKPQLRGRGLLARFLYSLPPSRVGYRELDPAPIPSEATAAYARIIRAALALEPARDAKGEPCPHVVRLSVGARAELDCFRERVERELRYSGELAWLRDWGSKLPGAVCRIAGVFHGLIYADSGNPASENIDRETMLGSISLGEYFVAHAKAAFGLMGSDAATALARRLLGWLAETAITAFSQRDAQRTTGAARVVQLDEPLLLLAEHGYIREQLTGREGPGRKPSPRFTVNPLWVRQK